MANKKRLTHSRTSVYNINYHFVWSVKYRKEVLTSEVEAFLKETLHDIAEDKGFTVEVVEVDLEDHVHLFVSSPPKLSPSYIIKMCKGISGRRIFLEFPEIKNKLWKGKLWNSSTFIETIGSTSEESIKKYIERQKTRG